MNATVLYSDVEALGGEKRLLERHIECTRVSENGEIPRKPEWKDRTKLG